MNNARKTVAGLAGVLALLLVSAAPASAAVDVSSLPSNVKVAVGDTVSVSVLGAAVCAGTTGVKAFTPGKQDAVTVTTPAACSAEGTLTATITPKATSPKKNAVVKFTAMKGEEKIVQTLVVKVTGKTNKPGNGPRS